MPGIDTLSDTERTRRLVLNDCTDRIAAAYLSHNPLPDGPLAELRRIVREALADAADPSNSVQPGVETVMSSSLGPFRGESSSVPSGDEARRAYEHRATGTYPPPSAPPRVMDRPL